MNSELNGFSEVWRPIPSYEGMYEVSNQGCIRSLDRVTQASNRLLNRRGKVLIANPDTHGYLHCRLWKDGETKNVWVHRVVLEAFDRPGESYEEACHNNGDKLDNRSSNLRWDTKCGNMRDRSLHGTQRRGEQMSGAKLTADDVRQIRLLRETASHSEIASKFGISRSYVSHIQSGKKWAHIQ